MSEETKDDILHIGEHRFTSRLLLGTAAYPDRQTLFDCLEQSGTQLVTVSLRRVSVNSPGTESLYEALTKRGHSLLPQPRYRKPLRSTHQAWIQFTPKYRGLLHCARGRAYRKDGPRSSGRIAT